MQRLPLPLHTPTKRTAQIAYIDASVDRIIKLNDSIIYLVFFSLSMRTMPTEEEHKKSRMKYLKHVQR